MQPGLKLLWLIAAGSIFANNLFLARFLGICTLFCPGLSLREILKIGGALIAVMLISSWLGWAVYYSVLLPWKVVHLKLPVFAVLTAVLVNVLAHFLRKSAPALFSSLGNYLYLFTAHCAVLGIFLLSIDQRLGFLPTTAFVLSSGLGGLAVMLVFAAIRDSLRHAPVPDVFRGYAIDLVALSLMSLAFLGFIGFLGIF